MQDSPFCVSIHKTQKKHQVEMPELMEPTKREKFAFPGLMERTPVLPHASGIHMHTTEKPEDKPEKPRRKEKPGPAAGAPPQPGVPNTGTNKTGKPRKIL
jgi:hypothetical protein